MGGRNQLAPAPVGAQRGAPPAAGRRPLRPASVPARGAEHHAGARLIGAFGRFEYALADRYRIERELGRGGMATVYLARDVRHSRPVALKLMRPGLSAERFLSEIRLTAGLTHPGIMPLYDSGEADGVPFYVMPFVGGETLRERLRRGGPLAVEDAVAIAEQVAGALDYAHRKRVVHRDGKPENILLVPSGEADGGERAVLMDLGVARAVGTSDEQRLTETGASPGTPLYMAPEQLDGTREVDGRADQYALAAVLYEMLVGEPPFTGANAHLRKLAAAAPSVREARPKVPDAVAGAVGRGLERVAADRYRSCGEFGVALRRAEPGPAAPPGRHAVSGRGVRWRRAIVWGATAPTLLVVLSAALVDAPRDRVWRWFGASLGCTFGCPMLDANRYAVFPFRRLGGGADPLLADVRLSEAIDRWRDLEVVEQYQARAAWERRDSSVLGDMEGVAPARLVAAGRYVTGGVVTADGYTTVTAYLHDATRSGRVVARATVRFPADSAPRAWPAKLADSLLFRGGPMAALGGTASWRAQEAYLTGLNAAAAWDLRAADSLFAHAVSLDHGFAKAQLSLAQTRSWRGEDASLWKESAQRAVDRSDQLGPHEQVLARALLHVAEQRFPAACQIYDSLLAANRTDFAASFGRGECRRLDQVVVRDTRSPSGWSFRSSSHAAVTAYRRAFELIPASNYAFREGSYSRLRQLLKVRASEWRSGTAASPDSGLFAAYAAWDTTADTLAFVPYRLSDPRAQHAPQTIGIALRRNREAFREVARRWTAAYSRSADAAEAMALALDLAGDDAAIDEIRRARRLAADDAQRVRLGATEVWLRVKFAPLGVTSLAAARDLADSLLQERGTPTPDDARLLAGVAALRGRPALAAQLAREGAGERTVRTARGVISLPRRVSALFAEYEARAVLGDVGAAAAAEQRLRDAVYQSTNDQDARRVERALIRNVASIAFVHGVPLPARVPADGYPLMEAEVALQAGDTVAARAALERALTVRRGFPIAEMTADARLIEGYLLAALAGPDRAAAWLDEWLHALPEVGAMQVHEVARVACVPAMMRLRGRIAERLGDRVTAAAWQSALRALQGS